MSVRPPILAAAIMVSGVVNFGIATPAFAGTQDSIAVSYDDLNLANPAGRAAFDRRISDAAASVCGAFEPRELGRAELGRDCIAATLAAVQPQREAALSQRFGTVRISQAAPAIRVVRAAH